MSDIAFLVDSLTDSTASLFNKLTYLRQTPVTLKQCRFKVRPTVTGIPFMYTGRQQHSVKATTSLPRLTT